MRKWNSEFKFSRLLSLGVLFISNLQPGYAQTTPLQVTVETGTLQGTQNDGVISFKGIPFAAPPVGERRSLPLNGLAFETRVLLVMIVCKSIFQPVLHQMRRN